MNDSSHHLTEEEVAKVLNLVNEADAILVGGQCMAIWARHYASYNEEIAKIYPMSSEDIDFYATRKAAELISTQRARRRKSSLPNSATPSFIFPASMITGQIQRRSKALLESER